MSTKPNNSQRENCVSAIAPSLAEASATRQVLRKGRRIGRNTVGKPLLQAGGLVIGNVGKPKPKISGLFRQSQYQNGMCVGGHHLPYLLKGRNPLCQDYHQSIILRNEPTPSVPSV